MSRRALAVVLAAGEGTRMRSAMPKVLHPLAGRSMLAHVLAAIECAGITDVSVVVGPGRDDVAAEAIRAMPAARCFVQHERLGTAHAVLAARDALLAGDDVLVLYADTPLIRTETILAMRAMIDGGAAVGVLGFEPDDPTGYGRLVVENGALVRIVEERDCTARERAIRLSNAGLMALDGRHALDILGAIGNANAKNEYYITDAVGIAVARGLRATSTTVAVEDVQGVNDRVQLAAAEAILQGRLRERHMLAGVTMMAPATVHLAHDTMIERDVVIEPHVVFGPGVTVREGAVIHAFSHIEGAVIGANASVGPFARLRPGTSLARKAKIGNFVELKAADIGAGAKVSHLTYLGDATVGAEANIGAGTITCNYDGFLKHRTTIGAGAFVGSNTALVAPVTVGEGAMIGAGSVITQDVPADALAVARPAQVVKEGTAAVFRARQAARKAARPSSS